MTLDTITRKSKKIILSFLALFLALGLNAQDNVLNFAPDPNAENEPLIKYNDLTRTIDIYLITRKNGEVFRDFNENNLKITEQIGNGEQVELPVLFQAPYRDSLFSSEELYLLKTRSNNPLHRTARTYRVEWLNLEASQSAPDSLRSFASVSFQKNWNLFVTPDLSSTNSFWDILLIGLLILGLLLLLLSEGIPFLRRMKFEQKYVFPYAKVQKEGQRKLHPITGYPIAPDEKVVYKCEKDICCSPYKMWKDNNYRCNNYPKNCEGTANIGFQQFFVQSSGLRKFNWLWFGALGGFLSWLIYYVFNEWISLPNVQPDTQSVLLTGVGLGLGLTSMLALVEELGEGRSFSIFRVLIRIALGLVVAIPLFYLASYLKLNAWENALIWLLFCILLGGILTIQSSITLRRGLVGGMIAGIGSALVYAIIISLGNPDAELARMITYITAGGILGIGLIEVVTQLQNIQMEVLSPSYRSGLTFSIDRWLNGGEKVMIGRDPKNSKIRVKWDDDFVLPHHAELNMRNNKVFIKPLGGGEIWVNDTRLENEKAIQLQGGEKIRLGRQSITAFKYLQRT